MGLLASLSDATTVASGPAALASGPWHIALRVAEPAAREALAAHLGAQGFALSVAEAFASLQRPRPQLALLQLDAQALLWCARLRAAGDPLPVVLLVGERDCPANSAALELGADDFVGPPYTGHELVARLRAVLRRCAPAAANEARGSGSFVVGESRRPPLRIGERTFWPHARCLQGPLATVHLSEGECALLQALASALGQPVSREELVRKLHGRADAARLRSVDVAVMRLRRVLELDPAEPRHLQTVRGCGYQLMP